MCKNMCMCECMWMYMKRILSNVYVSVSLQQQINTKEREILYPQEGSSREAKDEREKDRERERERDHLLFYMCSPAWFQVNKVPAGWYHKQNKANKEISTISSGSVYLCVFEGSKLSFHENGVVSTK